MRLAPLLVVAVVMLAGCADLVDRFRERESRLAGPGGLAADYVGGRTSRVLVELDAVAGSAPNREALADFEREVEQALGKPVDVRVTEEVRGRGATHAYTLAEIDALERAHRGSWTDGDTAVLYALYLDGGFEKGTAIGVAYHGSAVAMFKGTIRAHTQEDDQLLPTPSTIAKPRERFVERSVLVHEAGHLLGLVNNGIPMVRAHEMRRDPVPETSQNEGEKHSTSKASVMYWAVDTTDLFNVFDQGEDISWEFDADDLADLRAARGDG